MESGTLSAAAPGQYSPWQCLHPAEPAGGQLRHDSQAAVLCPALLLRHEDSAGAIQLSHLAHSMQEKHGKHQQGRSTDAGAVKASSSSSSASSSSSSSPVCGGDKSGSVAAVLPLRALRPNDSVSEHALRHHAKRATGSSGDCSSSCASSRQEESCVQQQQGCNSTTSLDGAHAQASVRPCDQPSDCSIEVGVVVDSGSDLRQHCSTQHSVIAHDGGSSTPVEGSPHDYDSQQQQESQPLVSQQCGEAKEAAAVVGTPWYRQQQVVLMLFAYGTVCLLFCAIDELIPIFGSSPLQQGELASHSARQCPREGC